MRIIYVHGFNSSGHSSKAESLRNYFPSYTIMAPTLSPDPRLALGQLSDAVESNPDDTLLVGSSLGGFYALLLSISHPQRPMPCFLINPSLKPYATLAGNVGIHIRFDTDHDEYDFKQEYLSTLLDLSKRIAPEFQQEKLIHLYLSEDDEVLDFSDLYELIPACHQRKVFKNSGHRFLRFNEILPDIQACAVAMK